MAFSNTKIAPITTNNPPEREVFLTRELSLMHMKVCHSPLDKLPPDNFTKHRTIKIDDKIQHLRQQSLLIGKGTTSTRLTFD